MGPAAGIALAIAGVVFLLAVVFLVVVVPLAPFARVAISKAALGFGPRLFTFHAGRTPIEVKLLPFTSYASFVGGNPYVEEAPPAPPRLLWLDAPVWRRTIAFLLAPRLAATIVPLLALGPARTLTAILRGMPEVFAAFGSGRPILERGAQVLASEGWLTLLSLAICKATAFSILLLPFDLPRGVVTRAMEPAQKTIAKIAAVVMLATLSVSIAWIVTWARWALVLLSRQ